MKFPPHFTLLQNFVVDCDENGTVTIGAKIFAAVDSGDLGHAGINALMAQANAAAVMLARDFHGPGCQRSPCSCGREEVLAELRRAFGSAT